MTAGTLLLPSRVLPALERGQVLPYMNDLISLLDLLMYSAEKGITPIEILTYHPLKSGKMVNISSSRRATSTYLPVRSYQLSTSKSSVWEMILTVYLCSQVMSVMWTKLDPSNMVWLSE